jgi:N-acetylneuraminic acid mutarotase
MPEGRDNIDAGACVIADDIYIFGGNTDNDVPSSTTYRFNTETNEWTCNARANA